MYTKTKIRNNIHKECHTNDTKNRVKLSEMVNILKSYMKHNKVFEFDKFSNWCDYGSFRLGDASGKISISGSCKQQAMSVSGQESLSTNCIGRYVERTDVLFKLSASRQDTIFSQQISCRVGVVNQILCKQFVRTLSILDTPPNTYIQPSWKIQKRKWIKFHAHFE